MRFEPNPNFEEIPAGLLKNDSWRSVFSARMYKPENIIMLEGRATLAALRHKARASHCFRHKHLLLGDNLGLVLALEKGRSSNFGILVMCRRTAAYSVALGSKFFYRWLPSELNHADHGSRRWEQLRVEEAAKLLQEGGEDTEAHHSVRRWPKGNISASVLLKVPEGECDSQGLLKWSCSQKGPSKYGRVNNAGESKKATGGLGPVFSEGSSGADDAGGVLSRAVHFERLPTAASHFQQLHGGEEVASQHHQGVRRSP
eukprot:8902369-Karenia_brevis.AAC.1